MHSPRRPAAVRLRGSCDLRELSAVNRRLTATAERRRGRLREPDAPSRILVTGGAGFVGSNLVDRLLVLGHEVTAYDNLSTGQLESVESALDNPRFRLERADLLDTDSLQRVVPGHDFVFHLAANADVRFGTAHP